MKIKKLGSKLFVKIERGEEIVSSLKAACVDNDVKAGYVTGIGATDEVEIGYFDVETKKYLGKKLTGDYEITSIIGNITLVDGEVFPHLHITLGDSEYRVIGGHLIAAVVSITCEIVVDVADGVVERKKDEEFGLNLWGI